MDKIRIRNLRSLKDTKDIDIKPLTILVGKNSSGKSTFLRFFPLMKQTLSTKKNEPILWYSKQNVDFGSFTDAINRKNKDSIIGFDFKFTLFEDSGEFVIYQLMAFPLEVFLSVELKEKQLSKISISNSYFKIEIIEQNEKYIIYINNQKVESSIKISNLGVFDDFLPEFEVYKTNENTIGRITLPMYFNKSLIKLLIAYSEKNYEAVNHEKLKSEYENFISKFSLARMGLIVNRDIDTLLKLEELMSNDDDDLREDTTYSKKYYVNDQDYQYEFDFNSNKDINILHEFLKNSPEDEYKHFSNLLIGVYLERLLLKCNSYLKEYFSKVHYIAPIRASAERYYRIQGLAVDEIDPQGENIPMAINHLSDLEKDNFKAWMKQNFGFEITTKNIVGHVTLNISFDNEENLNLTDTGFGFSQILPMVLLLWRIENNKAYIRETPPWLDVKKATHTIVIEQPELHLHPALQARLIDAFVNCIKVANKRGIQLNIIIETHSETIVNRVGKLIYKELVDSTQVNVLIFGDNKNSNPSESSITSVSFTEEGTIENWPLGFFYPEV
ncbi:AAA family ATPase [Lysinibacillus xylanilyticus]|uniref:AAA family ATPase n=1 Tax=Lysinibacillus xylanilyticus TaxID=582475 RepID=A0ABV3VQB4_9BACI